jgi:tRNA threonylcarbamoyl adenosine modification protein (Sua5/YciO/YrdC/YwlC family)
MSFSKDISKDIKNYLKNNKVIILPTDTVYGLATSIKNKEGIQRIYDIKGRNLTKPLSICIPTVNEIYKYAKPTISNTLLNKLLPGPVTLIFNRSENLPNIINPFDKTVGVRVLENNYNEPYVLTSANISGQKSSLNITECRELINKVDKVFDNGCIEAVDKNQRIGSTIVDLSQYGHYEVIRKGINHENIIKILNDYYY